MAATITDVAKAAGVSPSTVSRALGRPERVDPQTRARIFEQIERLGYTPNRAARSLITGRTGKVGVIVPDLANPFFPDVVKAIQACAHARNFTTLLADSGEDPATEIELLQSLVPEVDGIVLCGARMPDDELLRAGQTTPLVLINRTAPGIPSVTIDNAEAARQAVQHLRALRHRRIGFVGGPDTSRSNRQRLAGARAAALDYGLELIDLGNVAPSFAGGKAAADPVLLAEVSAVLTYNDVIAIGLIHRLISYGVRVPEEISVVGFDDIVISEMTYPALTTVRFPREEAGRVAVDHLLQMIGAAPGHYEFPAAGQPADTPEFAATLATELVVRESTTRFHLAQESKRA